MKLTLKGIKDQAFADKCYILPQFDIQAMREKTMAEPTWLHFGAGNLFRAFPCVLAQKLLDMGEIETGIIAVKTYDEDTVEEAFGQYDNLTLAVSLKSDGSVDKRVVASIAQVLKYHQQNALVEEAFTKDSLQMVTLTITEKAYTVLDAQGEPLDSLRTDFESPDKPLSVMAILAKLLYQRYLKNAAPIAMVSLDNCSHNGTILYNSIFAIASSWVKHEQAEAGFLDYLNNDKKVSFTWSMIDKITPRASQEVIDMLEAEGLEGAQVRVSDKNTYVSAIVNAEESEYLALEDNFPNGRPPLEKVGVLFGDRDMVDRIEKMKVSTCLNPLHTCLAIFGCLLGYDKISDEMNDETLTGFIKQIGYTEGLPVAADPGIINAKDFLDEVISKRFPNPFVPDTPQRIACDTSKKIPVRFGETLKAYIARGQDDLSFLTFIPLIFAGYARYLTGIGDDGEAFELSPDPNLSQLTALMQGFRLGKPFDKSKLKELFKNSEIFGINLYDHHLGEKAEDMFIEMSRAKGAIRATIDRYLSKVKGD